MKPNDTPPLSGSALSSLRAWAFGHLGVFGKDVAHYLYLPALFAVLAVVLQPVVLLILVSIVPSGGSLTMQDLFSMSPSYLVSFFLLTAYAVGLTLSTDEIESRTRAILDNLPGGRAGYALQKSAACIVLTIVWLALIVSAIVLISIVTNAPQATAFTEIAIERRGDVFRLMPYVKSPHWLVYGALAVLLVITGLAAGFVAGNLIGAGALGMVMSIIWLRIVTLEYPFFSSPNRDWTLLWGALAWTVLMWLVLWRRLCVAAVPQPQQTFIGVLQEQAATWRFNRRVKISDSPIRRQFRMPMIAASAGIIVCLPVFIVTDAADNWTFLTTILQILAGALIGAFAWASPERNGLNWFVYALPVPRSQLYWMRIRSLAWRVVILIALVPLLSFIEMIWRASQGKLSSSFLSIMLHSDQATWGKGMPTVLYIIVLPMAVAAFIASALALMQRMKIVVIALSVAITGVWIFPAFWSQENIAELWGGAGTFHYCSYLLWLLLVVFGIPLTAGWIAFCKSPLLEMPDGKRGLVTVIVFLFMLVWGGFLVAMSPVELVEGLFL